MKEEKNKIKFHFQRFEFKYLVNSEQKKAICQELAGYYMRPDEFAADAPQNAYQVNSIYFESPNFKCYRDKIDGLYDRFKLRLRFYGRNTDEGSNIFLEIKRKKGATVIKDRIIVEKDLAGDFLNSSVYLGESGKTDKEREIINKFFYLYRRFAMRPLICVKYLRQPMRWYFNDRLRVTFDYDLEASLYKDPLRARKLDNSVVMEIKYNNTLPIWLVEIIQKYGLQRTAFSKYAHCLEATDLKGLLPNAISTAKF